MIRAVLLAVAVLLAGCMAPAPVPVGSRTAAPIAAAELRPILWYVGVGLYDETWSLGGVAAAADTVTTGAQGFRVLPIVYAYGASHRYPPPSRINMELLTNQIARRAGPRDVVMLYVSTHGAPGLLAREDEGRELEPATVEELRQWLAPLGNRTTVLVLSACFSGSFIPALRADNRVILAAARPDRTSFGCQAGAQHTVFGAAFLDALATPQTSLRDVVRHVRGIVAARERDLAVSPPSDPQIFVGAAVQSLYEQPIF